MTEGRSSPIQATASRRQRRARRRRLARRSMGWPSRLVFLLAVLVGVTLLVLGLLAALGAPPTSG